jgi:hypothetical protein
VLLLVAAGLLAALAFPGGVPSGGWDAAAQGTGNTVSVEAWVCPSTVDTTATDPSYYAETCTEPAVGLDFVLTTAGLPRTRTTGDDGRFRQPFSTVTGPFGLRATLPDGATAAVFCAQDGAPAPQTVEDNAIAGDLPAGATLTCAWYWVPAETSSAPVAAATPAVPPASPVAPTATPPTPAPTAAVPPGCDGVHEWVASARARLHAIQPVIGTAFSIDGEPDPDALRLAADELDRMAGDPPPVAIPPVAVDAESQVVEVLRSYEAALRLYADAADAGDAAAIDTATAGLNASVPIELAAGEAVDAVETECGGSIASTAPNGCEVVLEWVASARARLDAVLPVAQGMFIGPIIAGPGLDPNDLSQGADELDRLADEPPPGTIIPAEAVDVESQVRAVLRAYADGFRRFVATATGGPIASGSIEDVFRALDEAAFLQTEVEAAITAIETGCGGPVAAATGSIEIEILGFDPSSLEVSGVDPPNLQNERLAGACVLLVGPRTVTVCDNDPDDLDGTDGLLRIDGLPPGQYEVTETQPPPGFESIQMPIVVLQVAYVRPGGTTRWTLQNFAAQGPPASVREGFVSLTILVVDEAGTRLGGSCFTVTNGDFQTSTCEETIPGVLRVADVPTGLITIHEDMPPAGYEAAPDQQLSTEDSGNRGSFTVEMEHRPSGAPASEPTVVARRQR